MDLCVGGVEFFEHSGGGFPADEVGPIEQVGLGVDRRLEEPVVDGSGCEPLVGSIRETQSE